MIRSNEHQKGRNKLPGIPPSKSGQLDDIFCPSTRDVFLTNSEDAKNKGSLINRKPFSTLD